MTRSIENHDIGFKAAANSGGIPNWWIILDETLDAPEKYYIQIDGPHGCVYFELINLQVIDEIIAQKNPKVIMGKLGDLEVAFTKESEFTDRYFIVVGSTSWANFTLVAGDDLIQAFRHLKNEIS